MGCLIMSKLKDDLIAVDILNEKIREHQNLNFSVDWDSVEDSEEE